MSESKRNEELVLQLSESLTDLSKSIARNDVLLRRVQFLEHELAALQKADEVWTEERKGLLRRLEKAQQKAVAAEKARKNAVSARAEELIAQIVKRKRGGKR